MKPLNSPVFPLYEGLELIAADLPFELRGLLFVVYAIVFGFTLYVFLFYIPLLMFVMGFIIVSLVLAGFLLPAHARRDVWRFSGVGQSTELCIAGNRIDPKMSCELHSRCEVSGMRLVAATALFGLMTMAGAWMLHPRLLRPISDSEDPAFMPAMLFFFLSFLGLVAARRWYAERRLLSEASVTLGNLDPAAGSYDFRDPWGSSYGGTKKIQPENRHDNRCLVFYRPSNPARNIPSAAMAFHRTVVEVEAAKEKDFKF